MTIDANSYKSQKEKLVVAFRFIKANLIKQISRINNADAVLAVVLHGDRTNAIYGVVKE